MKVKATLVAGGLAFALAAQSASAAPEVSLTMTPEAGIRLGDSVTIEGRAFDGEHALSGRRVLLEASRHPFKDGWWRLGEAVTDDNGAFKFVQEFQRNNRVRVRLAAVAATATTPELPEVLSDARNAFVLPAFKLSYKQHGRGRVRMIQTYEVDSSVRLTAPTRFYLGPCDPDAEGQCTAQRAPFVGQAKTVRRKGRYEARRTVRIPRSYAGRFSYVSCFNYSNGSGMGDPMQRCPRRSVRLMPATPSPDSPDQ